MNSDIRVKYIAPIYTEDVNNKVIYMNTFSKTMVPSLRISYMVLPVDILERYKETMSFYSVLYPVSSSMLLQDLFQEDISKDILTE